MEKQNSKEEIYNGCPHEKRITKLEIIVDGYGKQLDKIENKIDELGNGKLSRAIQEQNSKLLENLIEQMNNERNIYFQSNKLKVEDQKDDRAKSVKKYQILFGFLGSGAVIGIINLLGEFLKNNIW